MNELNFINEIIMNDKYSQLGLSETITDKDLDETKPVVNKKKLLTSDFVKRLSNHYNESPSILPPNCRYFEQTNKGPFLIIEEPPLIRTVSIDSSISIHLDKLQREGKLDEYDARQYLNKSRPHTFSLAFPYVVFFILFSDDFDYLTSNIFIRTKQISGLSDILFKMPMLNINSSQDVCYGNKVNNRNNSLYAAVYNTISVWWGAQFNHDYENNFAEYKVVPIINKYLDWQYNSRINPMFVFNVEWLKYRYNISQMINYLKERIYITPKRDIKYIDMINLFTKTKPVKQTEDNYREKLNYDVAQCVHLQENIYLNVGDPIKMKNGELAFVYSVVGLYYDNETHGIKYIQFEKNGKLFLMKYTRRFKKFVTDQILKDRFVNEATLKNGVVVKANDIIVIKSGDTNRYKKVEYIRRTKNYNNEDIIEIKCGPSYFIADQVDATLLNIKEPTIGNIKLSQKTKYVIIRDFNAMPMTPINISYFTGFDVSPNGSILVLKFKNSNANLNNDYTSISMTDPKLPFKVLELNEKFKPLPEVFRCGRSLFKLTGSESKPMKTKVWAYEGRVFYDNYYSVDSFSKNDLKTLINGDTFFIVGVDFDTSFSIGDRVIVANWNDPIEVLNVKTIQGFKINNENADIYFVLQSKDGTISEELYVSVCYNMIKTGYIRKVTNEFKNLSVGTKIKARKSGIACFPKKNVNIIVAIIIDGPYEPLILCSNGCTLWYSSIMNDFQKIKMTSKRWEKLQHIPLDISKIKFQSGDIINWRSTYKNSYGYLLFDPSPTRFLKALPISYYTTYPDIRRFDKYFMQEAIFDCIPTPRLSPSSQNTLPLIRGFFDFHGGVIKDSSEKHFLIFTNERGGMSV
jgi:hypothetical protein